VPLFALKISSIYTITTSEICNLRFCVICAHHKKRWVKDQKNVTRDT
jgi:hypothetical protein